MNLESIEEEVKQEQARIEKARQKQYKYKEVYGTIFFSEIPRTKQIQGIDGAALTMMNRDKSAILKDVLAKLSRFQELLGELQFAFATFLLGENYESFEQWKRLLVLLCNC